MSVVGGQCIDTDMTIPRICDYWLLMEQEESVEIQEVCKKSEISIMVLRRHLKQPRSKQVSAQYILVDSIAFAFPSITICKAFPPE